MCKTHFLSKWMILNGVLKKIIRYMAIETLSGPPPPLIHGKIHIKVPFWLFVPLPYGYIQLWCKQIFVKQIPPKAWHICMIFFKISFHTNVIPCPRGGSSFRAQNLYEFGQLLGIEDFALLKVFCSWREQAWNCGGHIWTPTTEHTTPSN